MKPLRVCLCNDSFPPTIDGVANTVVNYGKCITRMGGRAVVVTPYYPDADDSAYPFPVCRFPSLDMTRSFGYRAGIPFSPEVFRQVRQENCQIIHSHCPFASTILARALRDQCHVPVVFTYHTKFDIDIENVIRSPLLRKEAVRLVVRNISACDEVWTVSRGAGENLRSLGYEGEYLVMPNGVDLPCERVPEQEAQSVGAGLDLPAGVPVFLFAGRLMWYKGIRLILESLAGLKEKHRDFRMIFLGSGGDREEIMACTRLMNLSDKIVFLPPVQDRNILRRWYCRADLFLFPSTFDTNGLVVREAAACGLPSILIRGSCAAEDVTDGRNAFLIEEDSQSMEEMLLKLYGQRELLRRVGAQAQRELYLSWDEAVAQAYDRYHVVAERYAACAKPPLTELTEEFVRTIDQLRQNIFKSKQ